MSKAERFPSPVRCVFAERSYKLVSNRDWGAPYMTTPYPPAVGDLVTLSRDYDTDYDQCVGTYRVLDRQWVYTGALDDEGMRSDEGSPEAPVLYCIVEEAMEMGTGTGRWYSALTRAVVGR